MYFLSRRFASKGHLIGRLSPWHAKHTYCVDTDCHHTNIIKLILSCFTVVVGAMIPQGTVHFLPPQTWAPVPHAIGSSRGLWTAEVAGASRMRLRLAAPLLRATLTMASRMGGRFWRVSRGRRAGSRQTLAGFPQDM